MIPGRQIACSDSAKKGPPLDTSEKGDQDPSHATKKAHFKRARKRYFSMALAAKLYANGGPLKRQYGRTFDCADLTEQQPDNRLITHYCGYRWCLVCNSIRIARAMDRYGPVLDGWTDPHFVTLTIPNMPGHELAGAIDGMIAGFTSCKRSMRRTHQLQVKAIRKLECTHNADTGLFHPHFHVLTEGEVQAEAFRSLWLDRFSTANMKGQDVQPVTDGSLMEVFKYFTQLISKGTKAGVHVESLDTIFRAMHRKHVWRPVGFCLPPDATDDPNGDLGVERKGGAWKRLSERVLWKWMQEYADWIDQDTGDWLTGYDPSDRFRNLVEGITPGRDVQRAADARTRLKMAPGYRSD